jgi:metallo-beta-lactamase class B
MIWGGTAPPAALADKRTYLSSVATFSARMRRAGVDVELSNHPFADYGLPRMEELRADAGHKNPFVIGAPRTQRYMKVIDAMLRGRMAEQEAAEGTGTGTGAGTAEASTDMADGCC